MRVRHALLQRDTATFTAEGIRFKKCYYSCPEAVAGGWFVDARISRFAVNVSYETRLVDTIFVHHPHRQGELIECKLTPRSQRFAGRSFTEVAAIKLIDEAMAPAIEHLALQVGIQSKAKTDPIVAAANKKLKEQVKGVKRHARRVDTKPARQIELTRERQATAPLSSVALGSMPKAPVLQLRPVITPVHDGNENLSPLQKAAQAARNRVLRG